MPVVAAPDRLDVTTPLAITSANKLGNEVTSCLLALYAIIWHFFVMTVIRSERLNLVLKLVMGYFQQRW